MDQKTATLLSQSLVILGMVALIYGRVQRPEPGAAQILGADRLIVIATGIIFVSLMLTIWTFVAKS